MDAELVSTGMVDWPMQTMLFFCQPLSKDYKTWSIAVSLMPKEMIYNLEVIRILKSQKLFVWHLTAKIRKH